MMWKLLMLGFYFLPGTGVSEAQQYRIESNKEKFSLNVENYGGIIILPVSINGSKPLNFMLDSGSPYTIISDISVFNFFKPKEGALIKVQGLGRDRAYLDAYLSKANTIRIGKAVSNRSDIIVLLASDFDLGQRFGIPIYGVIGYDLFRDFVVEINYSKEKLRFYKPEYFYKKNRTRSYEEIPIQIKSKKAYLDTQATINGQQVNLHLLLDTGSAEALWLYEKENKINVPAAYIHDYLGYGLNGDIFGKRSRIAHLNLGGREIENPTVTFPDSLSVSGIIEDGRDGSLGAEVLKRFNTIIDYRNSKLFLKKNRFFKHPFQYNLAGLELYQPYLEIPYLLVSYVRKNSPADHAGLQVGDVIQFIDGQRVSVDKSNLESDKWYRNEDVIHLEHKPAEAWNLISLKEAMEIFKSKPGRRVRIIYTRDENPQERTAEIILQSPI